MDVEIVWGSGRGGTALGAVDAALADAGIHNYNLVQYSSILPPDVSVTPVGTHERSYDVGAPVPVVLADTVDVDGGPVAAGVGWATAAEGGVVYEASADSDADCRNQLAAGLADARRIRDWDWVGDPEYHVIEASADAVVVGAVFPPLAYETP